MKIKFLGAAKIVTGSCYMIDTGKVKFLVDCGMFQGARRIKERNYDNFPFEPAEISFVILTHAHIDHSGLIPKLYKHGFNGKVITTKATVDLCSVILPDSGYIQEMEVERKNRKNRRAGHILLEPIYTAEDARKCLQFFHGIEYDELLEIQKGITLRLRDAGHILGSAIVELWISEGDKSIKIVFSGDLGNTGRVTVDDPSTIESADYLVVESTYGDRSHIVSASRRQLLGDLVQETFKNGGNVVIPAFAIERTQDLLYNLHLLIQEGKIKGPDIYIDSPLAIAVTEVFCENQHLFNREKIKLESFGNQECPLYLPGLQFSRTAEESIAINKIKTGAVIISASGMADAGRIRHHLKHNLWRPESTIIFVGYQAPGTLGRRLIDGTKKVRIHGEQINVKARIVNLEGLSAHADQKGIIEWISSFKRKPEKIFVTHGEPRSSEVLARLLEDTFQSQAINPEYLDEFELGTDLIDSSDHQPVVSGKELLLAKERIIKRLEKLVDLDKRQTQEIYHVYNTLKNIEKELN